MDKPEIGAYNKLKKNTSKDLIEVLEFFQESQLGFSVGLGKVQLLFDSNNFYQWNLQFMLTHNSALDIQLLEYPR